MKAGKSENTQGHLKKKITDLQRQIKQTARETAKYVTFSIGHFAHMYINQKLCKYVWAQFD